jgi:DNA-binding transcriptional MerR regulator
MSEPASAEEPLLTIQELSQRVGMSVRNLREWRTLGLLPPAEMRGRVGYYDSSYVESVERIQQLHAEGFTLDLIRRLLDAGGTEVLRFARDLRAPFRDAQPPPVDSEAWDVGDIERAIAAGLMRRRGDVLEFTSARAREIADGLGALGLSTDEIIAAAARIRRHADAMAAEFEAIWREHVWDPGADLGELQARIGDVQSMAMDAVVALFTVAMEAQIERGIAREVGS